MTQTSETNTKSIGVSAKPTGVTLKVAILLSVTLAVLNGLGATALTFWQTLAPLIAYVIVQLVLIVAVGTLIGIVGLVSALARKK